jgi:glycosyltransferase involved in cell wall biosynthesis
MTILSINSSFASVREKRQRVSSERVPGLVSVVVPIFNAQPFLDETIPSVLAQSYAHWELLLIDDGSSDDSSEIAQRYQKSDPTRIRCFAHPSRKNEGVCATRNLGIAQSRGEFVAFLDADDLWLPEKLEQQVAILRAHSDVGLLYGRSIYFEEGADKTIEHVPALAPGEKIYRPPELLKLNYPLGTAGAPCPSSFLARPEALAKVGGFEERFNRRQAFEDQAFLAKIYLNVPVFVSDAIWDKYRCHPISYSYRALRAGEIDRARPNYLQWLSEYLHSMNVDDPEIWQAMARSMWPFRHPYLARMQSVARAAAKRIRHAIR